ncbi:hypothetical protein MUK42_15526 [Musa troglodytarum]|uniref:Uncharacterized protein n=1 Tax=Musa troglodytarum TaxID=320322 RepID=A0A9E7HR82_9LILI|nr:hypothetical protein MUK42_15526 [Musa troglodytarum]
MGRQGNPRTDEKAEFLGDVFCFREDFLRLKSLTDAGYDQTRSRIECTPKLKPKSNFQLHTHFDFNLCSRFNG